MGGQAQLFLRFQVALTFACFLLLNVRANYVPYLAQSFFFSWDPPGPLQIPVTEQCQVINITWQRAPATGPNPTAPYFLQVYSSAYPYPFVIPAGNALAFSWPVPFPPNTRYQICMFDINGNTGGCQAIYTMIPSSTNTTSCTNVTIPAVTLGVVGTVQSTSSNGSIESGQPWSNYGWVDQCTDISILPKNGTPPYTLTVAVSSHPPYNITVNSVAPLNWTVGLTWASSFFVSVFDSVGNTWASGPLHSGGPGTTACLSQNSTSVATTVSAKKNPPPAVSIGAGIGGLALGLLVGIISAYCFMRRKEHKQQEEIDRSRLMGKTSTPGFSVGLDRERPMSASSSNTRPTLSYIDGSTGMAGSGSSTRGGRVGRSAPSQYHVEALVLPGEGGPHHSTPSAPETVVSHSQPSEADYGPNAERSQVYVVHHDAGRPPVTVYTGSGAEVVELPPSYIAGRQRSTSGPSGARPNLSQRRSAAPLPAKKSLVESQTYTRDPPT